MIGLTNLQQLITASIFLVPIITALTSVVRGTFNLQTPRFVPLIAVVIGALLGILVISLTATGALVGVVLGLGSVGLYEFGKTTIANGRSSEDLG